MAILVVVFGTIITAAQSSPDFAGTWILDEARSGQSREVWFVSRAHKFVINHVGSGLTIDTDGSIADVTGPLTFKFDGSEITTVNGNIGDIPGWIRKIGTKATLDGATLTTYTGHIVESNGHETASVTIVLTFRLLPNGREMIVEGTGSRPTPPSTLHGLPYRQEDDLLYRQDAAIYARAAR